GCQLEAFRETPKSHNEKRKRKKAAYTPLLTLGLGGDVQGEAAGFADTKFGLEFFQDRLAGVAVDTAQQKFGGFAPKLVLGKFDGGEAGTENAEPRVIVEADQTVVLRAAQAHFFRGFQQTNGHQVIRHVDSVRPPREERMAGAITGFEAIV